MSSLSLGSAPSTRPRHPATPPKRTRGDRLTTVWMIAALLLFFVTLTARTAIPQSWWLSIHIITLGVLTNAILQWSWYFTRSLLRLRRDDRQSGIYQYARQWIFNLFVVLLVVGMVAANLWVVLVGAAGIGIVIAWHGLALVMSARVKLGSRFAVVIRYYMVAAVFLVVGTVQGAIVASAMFQLQPLNWVEEVQVGLTLSHSFANALGWIALTILGTLVTLWPTMLRTRIAEDAVERSTIVLPVLSLSLLVILVATTVGAMRIAGVGMLVYAGAAIWGIGAPLLDEAVRKTPAGYATWSAGSGLVWGAFGLVATAVALFLAPDADSFQTVAPTLIQILGVGGALQILVGALTYLLPVIIGGGPAVVRIGISVLETYAVPRLVLRNAGIALALTAGRAAPLFWLLVVVSFALDLVMFAVDGPVQGRAKRAKQAKDLQEVSDEHRK